MWTRPQVRRSLPRVTRAQLLGILGVVDLAPGPVDPGELAHATLAATALATLTGKDGEAVVARAAAAHAVAG